MRRILRPNNKIVLSMSCECGHSQVIDSYEPCWCVAGGWMSDAGTGYPTEVSLECPKCKSTLEVMG